MQAPEAAESTPDGLRSSQKSSLPVLDAINELFQDYDAPTRFNEEPDAYLERILAVQMLLHDFVHSAIASQQHRKSYFARLVEIGTDGIKKIEGSTTLGDKPLETATLEPFPTPPTSVSEGLNSDDLDEENPHQDIISSVSALDEFHNLFPSAVAWFNSNSSKCSHRILSGDRCSRSIVCPDRATIQQKLQELESLSLETQAPESTTTAITELADLVFCSQHRTKARTELRGLAKSRTTTAMNSTQNESKVQEGGCSGLGHAPPPNEYNLRSKDMKDKDRQDRYGLRSQDPPNNSENTKSAWSLGRILGLYS